MPASPCPRASFSTRRWEGVAFNTSYQPCCCVPLLPLPFPLLPAAAAAALRAENASLTASHSIPSFSGTTVTHPPLTSVGHRLVTVRSKPRLEYSGVLLPSWNPYASRAHPT